MTLEHVAYRIKIPYPLEWGAPTFDAGHAFGMMAAVLVSLIEVLYIFTEQGVLAKHFFIIVSNLLKTIKSWVKLVK